MVPKLQLNGSKYCNVTLTIQFHLSQLFTHSKMIKQFYLTLTWDPNRYYHSRPEWDPGVMATKKYSTVPKAAGWKPHRQMQSSVIFRLLVKGFFYPFTEMQSVIYNPSWLGYEINGHTFVGCCFHNLFKIACSHAISKTLWLFLSNTNNCIQLYIYMQISLNIIDILCLHIFFWIRSNSRIIFIVFGGELI